MKKYKEMENMLNIEMGNITNVLPGDDKSTLIAQKIMILT